MTAVEVISVHVCSLCAERTDVCCTGDVQDGQQGHKARESPHPGLHGWITRYGYTLTQACTHLHLYSVFLTGPMTDTLSLSVMLIDIDRHTFVFCLESIEILKAAKTVAQLT